MKRDASRAASLYRGKHGMDEALKAGIGAAACSVLILAFVLLLMHTLPVGAGTVVPDQLLQQARTTDVSPAAWPAPVGHRQPRTADIPVEMPQIRDSDAILDRLDRVLDGKLMICRGC